MCRWASRRVPSPRTVGGQAAVFMPWLNMWRPNIATSTVFSSWIVNCSRSHCLSSTYHSNRESMFPINGQRNKQTTIFQTYNDVIQGPRCTCGCSTVSSMRHQRVSCWTDEYLASNHSSSRTETIFPADADPSFPCCFVLNTVFLILVRAHRIKQSKCRATLKFHTRTAYGRNALHCVCPCVKNITSRETSPTLINVSRTSLSGSVLWHTDAAQLILNIFTQALHGILGVASGPQQRISRCCPVRFNSVHNSHGCQERVTLARPPPFLVMRHAYAILISIYRSRKCAKPKSLNIFLSNV